MSWPTPEKSPVPKPFEDLKAQFLALETRTRLSMEEMLAHLAVTDASGKNFRSEPFAHYLALSITSVIVAFMALDECPTLANYRMFCEAHDLFLKDKEYANASDEQLRAESENFRKSVASIPRVEGETLPAIQILEQYDEQYRTQEAPAARESFYKLAEQVVGQLTPSARAPQTYLKVFRQALGLAAIPDPNDPHAGKHEPAPDLNTLLAQLDALTGLKNRRKFDAVIDDEWRRATRQKTPLALLMIDADHFKSYNDTFGHQAGDQMLVGIAICITDSVRRAGDCASRYGGEEFAVLLPGLSAVEALRVAETIRLKVQQWSDDTTVSIGIASLTPAAAMESSVLVNAADRALYAAKANGRNRSVLASMPKLSLVA